MKPSIAILITNLEGGGAQRVVLTQARILQEAGYPVELLTLEAQESYEIPQDLSVTVLSKVRGNAPKWRKLFAFFTLPFTLGRYIRKHRIDICISHLERADFINVLSKPIGGHTSIGVVHSHLTATYATETTGRWSAMYFRLVKWLEPFQDRIVAVSREIRHNLEEIGLPTDKLTVIHNPFPIQTIQQKSQESLNEYEALYASPTLISSGRLARQKGIWHVLKLLPSLKQDVPDLSYIILGDGPLREQHISFTQDLNLRVFNIWEDSLENLSSDYDVYFLGFQQNPFMFIRNADMFILPSHYEGLPNVIIESLICKTPVIATDSHAGPRELLAPNTEITQKTSVLDIAEYGILTPVPDSEYTSPALTYVTNTEYLLKQAIQTMLEDYQLRQTYTDKAPQRIEEFAEHSILQDWISLLDSLSSDDVSSN